MVVEGAWHLETGSIPWLPLAAPLWINCVGVMPARLQLLFIRSVGGGDPMHFAIIYCSKSHPSGGQLTNATAFQTTPWERLNQTDAGSVFGGEGSGLGLSGRVHCVFG